MNNRIDTKRLQLLFAETLRAPEESFPSPHQTLTISPEETDRLSAGLAQAFQVKDHHAFVLDGAHQ